jgi:hypothetical protein
LREAEFEENGTSIKNEDELEEESAAATDSTEVVLKIMRVGGGKDRKPPLDQFLDLVRKCHKDKDSSKISEVIVTDRYILKPANEDGVGGGYDNFVAYLDALGLDKETNCILKFSRGDNSETCRILERLLKNHFPSISINSLNSKLKFHARFYFVRYKNGQLEGLFGPSLNGLRAESVVLMGKLENDALKRLDQMFE